MNRSLLLSTMIACGGGSATTTATDDPAVTDDPSTTDTAATTDTERTDTPSETTDTSTTPTQVVTNYRLEGPATVTEASLSLEVPDCTLDYTLFVPDGDEDAPLLVLGHGFQRAPRHMAGLARHAASHGLRVATPAWCWDRLSGSDHPRNGSDAAALAEHLAPGAPVVYAGQSVGGLASFFAADLDPDAVGVLGLDPVDTDDQVDGAFTRDLPRWALMGEPTACSDNADIIGALEAGGTRTSALIGATHCDFELPTDGLCTALCGGTNGSSDVVKTVLAAFAADRHGIDPTARAWVDGESWQGLLDAGVAVELQAADPPW